MSDSKLYLIAMARDDHELRQRISAAMIIQASIESQKDGQSEASKRMSDFVLVNPTGLVDRAFNLLAAVPALTNKFVKAAERIDTSAITDAEIQAGLAGKWEWLAVYLTTRGLV